MTVPIRVKMLTGLLHPAVGGAERQALLLSKALVAKGLKVSIVTTRYDRSLPREECVQGLRVRRVYFSERFRFGRIGLPLYGAALWRELFRSRGDFDILHTHVMRQHAAAGLLSAKLLGKKSIVKPASAGPAGDIEVLKNVLRYGRICLPICRGFDRVIALTGVVREELEHNGFPDGRIVDIPNGVDSEHFCPVKSPLEKLSLRRRLGLSDKVTLCYTGRLAPQKRLDDLLGAMRRLRGSRLPVQLLLVGDGPERQRLGDTCRDSGLSDSVFFAGSCSDVRDWLRASDIFVISGHSEGMSNSLLEAMSCGLPAVAFRGVSGNAELIEDGFNGCLADSGNVSQLTSALLSLARQPDLCAEYGRRARRTVVEKYSINSVADRYIALYKDLLAA